MLPASAAAAKVAPAPKSRRGTGGSAEDASLQVIEGYDLDKASLDQKIRDFARHCRVPRQVCSFMLDTEFRWMGRTFLCQLMRSSLRLRQSSSRWFSSTSSIGLWRVKRLPIFCSLTHVGPIHLRVIWLGQWVPTRPRSRVESPPLRVEWDADQFFDRAGKRCCGSSRVCMRRSERRSRRQDQRSPEGERP